MAFLFFRQHVVLVLHKGRWKHGRKRFHLRHFGSSPGEQCSGVPWMRREQQLLSEKATPLSFFHLMFAGTSWQEKKAIYHLVSELSLGGSTSLLIVVRQKSRRTSLFASPEQTLTVYSTQFPRSIRHCKNCLSHGKEPRRAFRSNGGNRSFERATIALSQSLNTCGLCAVCMIRVFLCRKERNPLSPSPTLLFCFPKFLSSYKSSLST